VGAVEDLIEGLANVAHAGEQVLRAGDELACKAENAFDRLADPETMLRVAEAGVTAAVGAAAAEVKIATGHAGRGHAEHAGGAPTPGIACDAHGRQPWSVWRKTIVCTAAGCGRVYQTQNPHGAHFAPPACVCGAALRPVPKGSAEPLCSPCFDAAIEAGVGRMVPRHGGSQR
jgi:hypothetical protein